jgi:prefoldin alpha subunit
MMESGTPEKGEQRYSLEELQYTLQVYQERYNIISDQIKAILESMESISAAQEALRDPKRLKDKNTLLNLGGNTFANAVISDPENIVVGIGAGLMVEKDIEGANLTLKKRLDRQNEALGKLMQERKRVEETIYDLSYRINEGVD